MRYVLTLGLLLSGFALLSGVAPPARSAESRPAADVELFPIEQKLLDGTNAQRARFGLPPLAIDAALVESARRHAAWMCANGSLTHSGENVGENIALGQRSPEEAMRDWMNSSGHRANILNTEYTRIGVAAYQLGDDGQIFWCQQFLR